MTLDQASPTRAADPDADEHPVLGRPATVVGLGVSAVLFVLAIGLRSGEFNLIYYLLRGIYIAEPSALRNDWYTESTEPIHLVWNEVVGWADRAGMLEWFLTLGAVACGVSFALALFLLVKATYRQPVLPWIAALALLAGCYTRSIGEFHLLPPTLEPFGLGGAALVFGLAGLAWRRPFFAGFAFGVSAFWHLHVGWLAGLLLLGATISAWKELRLAVVAKMWVPYIALALPNLVLAVRLSGGDGSSDATAILMQLAPQHYEPWTTNGRLMVAFAASLSAGVCAILLRRPTMSLLLRGAVITAPVVVVLSMLAGSWFGVDLVIRAMPWRLAPFVLALAYAAVGASLFDPRSLRPSRSERALYAMLILSLGVTAVAGPTHMQISALAVVVASLVWRATRRPNIAPALKARRGVYATMVIAMGLVVLAASGLRSSHVHFVGPSADRAAVYQFAEDTPVGTVFAVPPDFSDFRLLTRRAIVGDWASVPFATDDVFEWRDRLRAISGTDELSLDAVMRGSEAVTCPRLRRLAVDYGADYLIIATDPPLDCTQLVLDGGAYRVFQIG